MTKSKEEKLVEGHMAMAGWFPTFEVKKRPVISEDDFMRWKEFAAKGNRTRIIYSQWRRVEDEIPEDVDVYLVNDVIHKVCEAQWTGEYFIPSDNSCEFDEVTHWMPLPEGPE